MMKTFIFIKKLFLVVCVLCCFNACTDPIENPYNHDEHQTYPDSISDGENPPTPPLPTIAEFFTITFDELPNGIVLNDKGVWDGSNNVGGFSIDSIWFNNIYNPAYGGYSDGGFNISDNVDMTTAGVGNQYSVYNVSGANGSKNFAVVYYSPYASEDGTNSGFTFEKVPSHIKSVKVNNSTYVYLSLRDGDGYTSPIADNDWFKVIFTGVLDGKNTASVEFFLADFRNGKKYICKEWTEVDLRKLGVVDQVKITFDGTDKGEYGLNTPAYVCIDDIEIENL